ncbi:MAG: 16S rRNA (guanine(966)-N(2))-methyltransferase RsmD [Acidimicrobiales bacterium]
MRVVAGEARGRRLVAPEGKETRPTLDRVREAMFNSLVSIDAIDGATVLDLYAGSGALGIEALSRGAASCVFVDHGSDARRAITINLETTGFVDQSTVVPLDAVTWLRQATVTLAAESSRFDLVLIDPPYAAEDQLWSEVLALVAGIAAGGVVVTESERTITVPEGWDTRKEKRYGGTIVSVLLPPDSPESP